MSDQPRLTDAPPRVSDPCTCSEFGPCPAHALPLLCWWCDQPAAGTVLAVGRTVPACADHAAEHRGYLPILVAVAS